jgi:translation initiation factor 1
MGRKQRKRQDAGGSGHDGGGFGGTFGDLLRQQNPALAESAAAVEPAAERTGEPQPAPRDDAPTTCGKVVVRRTRKGRGGKTVTLLEGLPTPLDPWAKAARKALGCGARVEDADVVLQGDQVERAEAWLSSRGVGRVVRGS